MLDKNTFGNSPAAMYLSVLLNERNNPLLNRKVGRTLTAGRETLNELVDSHFAGNLSIRTLNRQLTLISQFNHTSATLAIASIDPFIANIVINILEGEVKTWKRRGSVAAIAQRSAARTVPSGTSVPKLAALPVAGEKSLVSVTERSKAYLARKGKINTLY